jgi:hypothetical protein
VISMPLTGTGVTPIVQSLIVPPQKGRI